MRIIQTRRRFLATASLAGAVSLVGAPRSAHSEPPPETTTVRLPRWTSSAYCWAPAYLAGELLRVEVSTDVQNIKSDPRVDQSVGTARGETFFSINPPP